MFAAGRAAEGDRSAAKGGGSGAEIALLQLRKTNLSLSVFCCDKIISAENFYSRRTKQALRGVAGACYGREMGEFAVCIGNPSCSLDIKIGCAAERKRRKQMHRITASIKNIVKSFIYF